MKLRELIDILWSAKISGNDQEIRQAYSDLADIGINKTSADIILKEWHPSQNNIEFEIVNDS